MTHRLLRRLGLSLSGVALLGWNAAAQAQDANLPPLLDIVAEAGDQDDPATAFNLFGLRFLVVWEQQGDDGQSLDEAINARFVTPRFPLRDGEVRLGDIFTLSDNDGVNVNEPSLAVSRKGDFLVTWTQEVDESESIDAPFVTLLDSDGRTLKEPFRLDPANCDTDTVNLAYDSRRDQWLVVWDRDEDGTDEDCTANQGIKGVILDRRGDQVGDIFDVSTPGLIADEPYPAFDKKRGRFLVGWEDNALENQRLLAQQLRGNGERVGAQIMITLGVTTNADISLVYDWLRDRFLAVWQAGSSGEFSRIEGRFVKGGSGDLGNRFFISDNEERGSALDPAIAKRGFFRFLVIWDEEDVIFPSERNMFGQSLRRNGNPIGDNFVLAGDPGLDQNSPADIHRNISCFGALCLTLWEQSLADEGSEVDIAGRLLFTQP